MDLDGSNAKLFPHWFFMQDFVVNMSVISNFPDGFIWSKSDRSSSQLYVKNPLKQTCYIKSSKWGRWREKAIHTVHVMLHSLCQDILIQFYMRGGSNYLTEQKFLALLWSVILKNLIILGSGTAQWKLHSLGKTLHFSPTHVKFLLRS